MENTWVNIVDTAIKIGLGSFITAISGYLVLKKNHAYEKEKEHRSVFYEQQEEKKIKYVDFLSQSQELVQIYKDLSCYGDTEEYKSYSRSFNEVQIISNDKVRVSAYNLFSAVQEFIIINKNSLELDVELRKTLRNSITENLGLFQKIAQLEVTKIYK